MVFANKLKSSMKTTAKLKAFPVTGNEEQPFNPAEIVKEFANRKFLITEKQVQFINNLVVKAAALFEVKTSEILSDLRSSKVVRARYLVVYFLVTRTNFPYKKIGAFIPNGVFGRDHSTIIHSLQDHEIHLFRGESERWYVDSFISLLAEFQNLPIHHRASEIVGRLIKIEAGYMEKVKLVDKEIAAPVDLPHAGSPQNDAVVEYEKREKIDRVKMGRLLTFMGHKEFDHILDNFFTQERLTELPKLQNTKSAQ